MTMMNLQKKFNNAMNESKNVVRELDETIKNDLYEKI